MVTPRHVRSRGHIAALALSAALAAACGGSSTPTTPSPSPAPPAVTSVTVSGVAAFTGAGQTVLLTATATLDTAALVDVTNSAAWQSSNAAIATVVAGRVTSVGVGTATITATYQGKSGAATASVAADSGHITACGVYSGVGPYTVAADLNSGTPGCLTFSSSTGASVDCQGHDVSSATLTNVQNFTMRNCRMHGQYSGVGGSLRNFSIISGTNVTIDNVDELGEVIVQSCSGCTFSHDTFVYPLSGFQGAGFPTAELVLTGGHDNRIVATLIDAGWNGDTGSTYQKQGCDDGIVFNNETNIAIQGNTIRNAFDAGIEPTLSTNPITATVIDNAFSNLGYTAIGGYYVPGWQNSTFSGNTVANSPSIVWFDDSGADIAHLGALTLLNNQFTNNRIATPTNLPTLYGGHPAPGIYINYARSGLPYSVSGNVIAGNSMAANTVGATLLPASGFSDGGGNICQSSNVLTCLGGSLIPARFAEAPPVIPHVRRIR